MSTTDDRTKAANEVAAKQGQSFWLGGVREGYADIGEVQLH
jgi:hypothetical protein